MAKSSAFSIKTSYFQLFIAFSLCLATGACSGPDTPKVVTHHKNNGTGCGNNCTTKPTPETGDNAATYAALAMISIKQSARYIDLALNGIKSTYYHPCQRLSLPQRKSDTVDTITISMETTPNPDKKICKMGALSWTGKDEIEITYESAKRGPGSKIVKIEKKRGFLSTHILQDSPQFKKDIEILDELTLTLNSDLTYTFSYEAGLTIDTIKKSKSKESEANKNASTAPNHTNLSAETAVSNASTISAMGKFSLTNNEWLIERINLELKRAGTRVPTINAAMTLQAEAGNFTKLNCGFPLGQFAATQVVIKNATDVPTYNPTIRVQVNNDKGSIEAVGAPNKYRFSAIKCESGMQDLDDTATKADTDIGRFN